MAHRGYLVELRLTPALRGRWDARWSVFQTRPFCLVAHGGLAAPHSLCDGAQAAATRGALAWIETRSPSPALAAAGA
jgi:hypothetical protein